VIGKLYVLMLNKLIPNGRNSRYELEADHLGKLPLPEYHLYSMPEVIERFRIEKEAEV
jgi:hypothetical protein